MSTITVDEYKALQAKISADSEVIASLGRSVAVSLSFSGIFTRSLILLVLSQRLLRSMKKMDALCYRCDANCDVTFEFKSKLENVVTTWNEVIRRKEQTKFPQFVLRWENNVVEQFEDKLENYWIASDIEIKELAHSISEKMNQHALR
ncbi:MAG: hypothetical protein M1497_03605 [Nitrospirae bacterium]|nr:hypothetical protein [Nitrospirota bacterium]